MDLTDKQLQELLAALANRFTGKYRGFVADNQDPLNLGRVKVTVPAVLGPDTVSGWALPCVPYAGNGTGFLFVPEVDTPVWVEFEGGDPSFPIWSGAFWSAPGDTSEVPEDVVDAIPQKKILQTESGHRILFDDEEPSLKVLDAEENEILLNGDGARVQDKNSNIIEMTSDGMVITDANGNEATLDSSGVKVTDANGNDVTLDGSGVKVADANGNEVTLAAGQVTVASGGSLTLEATMVTLDATNVDLGSPATEPLVKGTSLLTWLASHTHVGNLGAPTSPPVAPPTPSLIAPTKKVG